VSPIRAPRLTDSVWPRDHHVDAGFDREVEVAHEQLALGRHDVDVLEGDVVGQLVGAAADHARTPRRRVRRRPTGLAVADLKAKLLLLVASAAPLLHELGVGLADQHGVGLGPGRRLDELGVRGLRFDLEGRVSGLVEVAHLLEQLAHAGRVAGDRAQFRANLEQLTNGGRQLALGGSAAAERKRSKEENRSAMTRGDDRHPGHTLLPLSLLYALLVRHWAGARPTEQ